MGLKAATTEPTRAAQVRIALPAAMIGIGILSVQFGAGLADRLFGQIPPAAVTGLRLWTAALAMVALSGRGFTRSVRAARERRAFADVAPSPCRSVSRLGL